MARSVGCEVPLRNLSISILLVLSLLTIPTLPASSQTCVQPPAGIVAWWPFDETSGTTALDIVGGHNGTYVGTPQAAGGMVSGSLQFDGISTYVVVPDNDLWAFGTSDFTLEFWANFDVPAHGSLGHPGDVFLSNDNGPFNVDKWIFALGSTNLEFIVGETATGRGIFGPVVPFAPEVSRWYHLALTRSGTTYKIYVDGVQVGSPGTNLSVIPNPASPLTIGAALEPLGSGMGFGGVMSGRLDEVTIYHHQLTEDELRAIVTAGSAGKCRGVRVRTETLSAIQLGIGSEQQLEAVDGAPPYSWSIAAGTLPPGIQLNPDGALQGTPTQLGSFTFTAQVSDSQGAVDTREFTLTIALVLLPPDIRFHKAGTIAVPGRVVDYFIAVENTGTVRASDAEVLEMLLPSSMFEVVRTSPPASAVTDQSILWVLPSLAPGETRLFTYGVRLAPAIPFGTQVAGAVTAGRRGHSPASVREQANNLTKLSCVDPACAQLAIQCTELYCPQDLLDAILPGPLWSQCVACLTIVDDCIKNCPQSCDLFPNNPFEVDCQKASGPIDPNEKLVLAGTFIWPNQTLVYPIHFENIGAIEARDVFVIDALDPNLDASTLQLLTPNGSFNPVTRTVRWDLLGINLQPGATDNVLLSIKPLPGLPSGTEIRNSATIQFEVFTPIATNEVVNIIDSTRPTCTVHPLPATTSTPSFQISWSGIDAVGEIKSYSVLVSIDGSNFTSFIEKTSDTSATFTGELGKTYAFLCVATDTAGNIEVQELVAEAITTVVLSDTTPPVITVSATPATLWPPNGKMVPVTIVGTMMDSGSGVNASTATYAVTDEYRSVQPSGSITLGSNGSYSFTISLQASRNGNDKDGRQYTIMVNAQDNAGNKGSVSTFVTVPHDQGK